jgi:N-acetylneuraminic acid mutarotase
VAVVHDNCLYVYGGKGSSVGTSKNQMLRYDTKSNAWSEVPMRGVAPPAVSFACGAVMTAARGGSGGNTPADSLVLCTGEQLQGAFMQKVYRFQFDTQTWHEVTVEGKAQSRKGAASAVVDSTLYVFGGKLPGEVKSNDLWKLEFDPNTLETCKWTCEHPGTMPGAPPTEEGVPCIRDKANAVLFESDLIVAGGWGTLKAEASVHAFNLVTKRWRVFQCQGYAAAAPLHDRLVS